MYRVEVIGATSFDLTKKNSRNCSERRNEYCSTSTLTKAFPNVEVYTKIYYNRLSLWNDGLCRHIDKGEKCVEADYQNLIVSFVKEPMFSNLNLLFLHVIKSAKKCFVIAGSLYELRILWIPDFKLPVCVSAVTGKKKNVL